MAFYDSRSSQSTRPCFLLIDTVPNHLFRRCVTGCPNQTPACPTCASNEVCSLVPPTCEECQKTICVASSAAPSTISSSSKSPSSGPNVAAIAGGVIGGVLAIAVVTYLVWRFCIKPKRQQYEQEDWAEDHEDETEAEKDLAMRRDPRGSTHTVASVASTVLTRASNIIQIAYIPGVTNRSAPSTPGLLVPPVPPIPIALSSTPSTPTYEQEHFFMPGDLRDSTYSGMSDRVSFARTSVASTIYGKNAILSPVPAQTMIRGKAAVVSVKSTGASTPEDLPTPGDLRPPIPNVDFGKYGVGPASPAFSVGSTFLNSATAATQVRPQVVRVATGSKKAAATSPSIDDGVNPKQSLLPRPSSPLPLIDDTPLLEHGPFRDPPRASSSLSGVFEEAQKRTSGGSQSRNVTTPFGDEHEMRD